MFGIASIFASFSADLQTLIIWKFLTGLGLGGALPNAITLTSEYAPTSRRSNLVTMMFCGFTIGSALGGIFQLSYFLILVGTVFCLLGSVTFSDCAFLIFLLPESIRFLVLKRRALRKLKGLFTVSHRI